MSFERCSELLGEVARSREEVRLECDNYPTSRIGYARCLQRCGDLGRVVRVIIHDGDAANFAKELEPSIDAAKLLQPWSHRVELEPERETNPNGAESVLDVVVTRHPQRDGAQHITVVFDSEVTLLPFGADFPRHQSRVGRDESVANHFRRRRHVERTSARIVITEHDRGGAVHESREARADVFEITINIEVICFYVRHYGNARREREKGSVVFISLDDEQVVTLVAEVAVPLAHSSTRNPSRLESRGRERCSGHDGRCRFAVSAGNANHFAVFHCTRQCFGASRNGNSQLLCAHYLGVIAIHR